MFTCAHDVLEVPSRCFTLDFLEQRSGECKGRGGRVSAGLLSCISLPLSPASPALSTSPLSLLLPPMPCQIHISHNRAESPCQQHCINCTALSCPRLSPQRHYLLPSLQSKISYLGYRDAKGCPSQVPFSF